MRAARAANTKRWLDVVRHKMAGVSIKNFTRQHSKLWATLPFSDVAESVLPEWDISLVFAGEARARALNKKLRGKSYTPNVLSYVVGDRSGEIIICLSEVEEQASAYNLVPSTYCLYLFIHGMLHLKGQEHSVTMEQWEQKLLTRYGTAHSHRNRHRDVPGKTGRR